MVKTIILGVLMLTMTALIACGQDNTGSPQNFQADNTSKGEIIEKPVGTPATPIPREEWPPIPSISYPPANLLSILPPEVSGNVVKIDSKEVSSGAKSWDYLLMFVDNATDASLGKFNLRITFDPKVMSVDIQSHADYLYDVKVDNALGVVELSVNPYPFRGVRPASGWLELGRLIFTAIGKPGDSTALHLTITSPVENLTTIDGVIRIKSEN